MNYYILTDKGMAIGNSQTAGFKKYARLKDLEISAKKQEKSVEDLLEKGSLLYWIFNTNGNLAKGCEKSFYFERYATKEEVEKSKTDISKAEIKDTKINQSQNGKSK